MDPSLREYLSYSVGIAAIIGLVRWRSISYTYLPFILLMVIGFANEILTQYLIKQGYHNNINTNIYCLLESILVLLLFRNWDLFQRNRYYYWLLGAIFILFWFLDWIFISPYFTDYFNIFYSFVVVLMSIHMVNRIVVTQKSVLVKNAQFLICLGFIIYFTFKILIEIFWVYGTDASKEFSSNVYDIMAYINFGVNLLFAFATLWIPRKQEYTLQ